MRGSLVIVRTYGDVPVVRRVWERRSNKVYISEESQFQRLMAGQDALVPIGFPCEDVFEYDPKMSADLAQGRVEWNKLKRLVLV